jgi:hypothetical protein
MTQVWNIYSGISWKTVVFVAISKIAKITAPLYRSATVPPKAT